jgi:hypothetical protein
VGRQGRQDEAVKVVVLVHHIDGGRLVAAAIVPVT